MQFEWIIVACAIFIANSGSTTCTTITTTTDSNSNSKSNSNSNSNSNNNSSPPAAVADLANRDIKRVWAATLQAINEAELQRNTLTKGHAHNASVPAPGPALPRPNSKRLKWRTNSKLLDRRTELALAAAAAAQAEAEQRSGTYPYSEEEDNTNPTYVDVRDHEAKPSPWWF